MAITTPTAAPNIPTTPIVGGSQPAQPLQPQSQQSVRKSIDPQYRFKKKQAVFRRILYTSIRPGAILTFQYLHWQHDPYPLVLSTGRWITEKMAGVNLHYLTYPTIRGLLNQFCGRNFSYKANVGTNLTIKKSFRSYHRTGMKNLRLLDCEFLIQTLNQIRSFNPTEVEAMRQLVREQMARKLGQLSSQRMLDLEAQGVFGEFSDIINPNFESGRYRNLGVPQGFNLK